VGTEGLGTLAKRWLKAKTKELTTTDNRTRDYAEGAAEDAERQFRNEATGEALLTAIPGLRRLRDRQLASLEQAEADRIARFDDELAARPVAAVTIRVDGKVDGAWSGELPAAIEVRAGDEDGDPDDPYADRPTLTVDLRARDGALGEIAGEPFSGWAFQVPGYAGEGTYDLAAAGLRRRDAGFEPEYLEWELALGGDGDGFFFQPDIGPTHVEVLEVADGVPRRLSVAMSMTGARGDVRVHAQIELPDRKRC